MSLLDELQQAAHERNADKVATALTERATVAATRFQEFSKWRDREWLTAKECSNHPEFLAVRDRVTAAIRETNNHGKRRVVVDFGDEHSHRDGRNPNPTVASGLNCLATYDYVAILTDEKFASVRNLVLFVDLIRHFTNERLKTEARYLRWTGYVHETIVFDPLTLLRSHLSGDCAQKGTYGGDFNPQFVITPALVIEW